MSGVPTVPQVMIGEGTTDIAAAAPPLRLLLALALKAEPPGSSKGVICIVGYCEREENIIRGCAVELALLL